MKRIIILLLLIVSSLIAPAQPGGYVNGTWANWSFNGRVHGFWKTVGWDKNVDNVLIWFNGDGQTTSDFSTHDDVVPGSILAAGQWNGVTNLPGGGNRKWLIITLGNSGTTTIPGTDIAYFWQNLVGGFDTAQRTRIHIGGLSGGPGRMWDWVRNALGDNSAYRSNWGTSISMSVAAIFDDLTSVTVNKKHYCWYGTADANPGTPPSFTINLYNNLIAGTPNVDKRLKSTTGGTHSDNTWGIWNNTATAMAVTGTDTATNRWLWMIYAYGNPGANVPPNADAGPDQVVTLPTSFTTLNASGSTDPDGTISTYQWIKIAGPAGGTITTPGPSSGAITTTITALQQGLYKYRLVVVDNGGLNDDDTVSIVVTNGIPSTNKILINTSNNFWPWTGKSHPENLFDGLIDKNIDQSNFTSFALPMKFAVELKDSVWDNLKLRFYNGFGATQTWKVDFYDSTRLLLGTYTFSNTTVTFPFMGYFDMPGRPDTIVKPVKWIHFEVNNVQSDIREIEIYADRSTKVTTLIPESVIPTILPDPGVRHFGGSAIGDKDTNYLKLANGRPLYPSFRAPNPQFVYSARDGIPYNVQPTTLNRFGDFGAGMLKFHKDHGAPVMYYQNGASMGAMGAQLGLTYSSSYNALAALQAYKDIVPGTDSTNSANWINTGRSYKSLAYLWGNNPSAVLPANYTFESGIGYDLTAGQNKIATFEIDNEPDKDWMGATGYHSPEVLLAKVQAARDSIRTIESNVRIHVGALLSMDTIKLKAMFFINYWKKGITTTFPANGFNFNQYLSTAYGGQPHSGFEDAVSPEQFQIRELFTKYRDFRDRIFPGTELRWTEIGFNVGNSDYSVVELPGLPDSVVAAMLMIRSIERSACVPNTITTVYNYFHTSDGTGTFGGMKMVREKFDGSSVYIGSDKLPIWYMYAMRVNTLWDYKGWSTLLVDGDSTGVNVYRRNHNTDATKKVYTLYNGTYDGLTTTNYVLNVGIASSATLVTYSFGNESGVQTPLVISGGTVTIPMVNEVPLYVVVSEGSPPPAVNKISKPNGVIWNVIQQ